MTATATATGAAPGASHEPAPAAARRRFAAWLRLAWPILALVAIPTIVFGGCFIFGGHLLLDGDNLIQNFPLRELVGNDIRHGISPTWDPWIWSGSPLLAGENASALYPTTLLFSVLSPGAAWVTGEILFTSSVAAGTYLFLRLSGVSSRLAGFLGAFSFACAGAVASQSAVHIDMAEGFASLPWMLIAVRKILDDGRWRWGFLLGLSASLLVLSGSPEALLDVGVLAIAYAALRLTVTPGGWSRLLTRGAVGGAFAVGSSALVWMPALAFIATSQRANLPTSFAASYAFPPQALILALVPYFEGGSKLFSQPVYFGESNLPEVSLYVGILPLVAVGAMLSSRWRRRLPVGEARTWLCVGAIGLVLAVGGGTPLSHMISHIPFYGQQRDQGRNIVTSDFAACALLAWWLDACLAARDPALAGDASPVRLRTRSEVLTLGTLLVLVAVAGTTFALSPAFVWRTIHDVPQAASAEGSIEGAVLVALVLVLGAAAVVVLRDRITVSKWRLVVTGFVLADVALFATGSSFLFSEAPPTSADPGPVLRIVSGDLTPGGRYAVFDYDLFYPNAVVTAGDPDVGILTGDPSAGGYGSVVNGVYAAQTGTHGQAAATPGEIATDMLREVGLEVIVAPPEEFLLPIGSVPGRVEDVTPLSEPAGVDPVLPGGDVPLPQDGLPALVQAGPRGPTPLGGQMGWFFGTTVDAARADLVLSQPADGQLVEVGTLTPSGALDWLGAQRLGRSTDSALELAGGPAVGVVVRLLSGPAIGESQLVVAAGSRLYLDDGPLVKAVTPESYSDTGAALDFAVFKSRAIPETVWAQPLGAQGSDASTSRLGATFTVVASSADSEAIEVDTPQAAILTRSVAYDAGWKAAIVSGTSLVAKAEGAAASGSSLPGARALPVHRIDLVQGVDVPAGNSLVRFVYSAPRLARGELVSALTLTVSALASIGFVAVHRRRRRRGAAHASPRVT
jgi:hypothetical protein